MAQIDPMHQFVVEPVEWLPRLTIPGTNIDISVTNSVLWMMIAATVVVVLFALSGRKQVVPGRLQSFGEMLYDLVDKGLVKAMIGDHSEKYVPLVMTIFMFILTMNFLGLFAFSFTPTTQLAVTVGLAIIAFLTILVI